MHRRSHIGGHLPINSSWAPAVSEANVVFAPLHHYPHVLPAFCSHTVPTQRQQGGGRRGTWCRMIRRNRHAETLECVHKKNRPCPCAKWYGLCTLWRGRIPSVPGSDSVGQRVAGGGGAERICRGGGVTTCKEASGRKQGREGPPDAMFDTPTPSVLVADPTAPMPGHTIPLNTHLPLFQRQNHTNTCH